MNLKGIRILMIAESMDWCRTLRQRESVLLMEKRTKPRLMSLLNSIRATTIEARIFHTVLMPIRHWPMVMKSLRFM